MPFFEIQIERYVDSAFPVWLSAHSWTRMAESTASWKKCRL
jgi:hypothetical protein